MKFTCFFCVLHKVLFQKKCKMRFLWHHINGKTDRNSRSRTYNSNPVSSCKFFPLLKLMHLVLLSSNCLQTFYQQTNHIHLQIHLWVIFGYCTAFLLIKDTCVVCTQVCLFDTAFGILFMYNKHKSPDVDSLEIL